MPDCPRCSALTTDELAYCAACGRPRIVESLRASVQPPAWLRPLQQIALVLLSLWLGLTLGVAFLREYKAVRDGRKLLADNQPEKAAALLLPFLQDHPQHEQGLLLGGQAAIRLGKVAEAKQCLDGLTGVSPDLAKQLGDDYQQVITLKARAVGCNDTAFLGLFASSRELGSAFPASVIAGSDGIVEACARNQEYWTLSRLSAQLAEQGEGIELVRKGYLPAVGRALGEARYGSARTLAQLAVHSVPAGGGEIRKLLDAERVKVEATKRTLDDLCLKLISDPRYHPGSTWCFPDVAPADLRSSRDGWGNPILYTAYAATPGQSCHSGIALTSYGAAGRPIAGERWSPAAGISCRIVWGNESWQLPDRYWQQASGIQN